MELSIKRENMHHAYLIPAEASFLPFFLDYLQDINIPTKVNPDFFLKETPTLTIDDAREIKEFQSGKAISSDRKIIIISATRLTRETENALLKVLEEPKEGVHFFILTPNVETLLPTLKSRLF